MSLTFDDLNFCNDPDNDSDQENDFEIPPVRYGYYFDGGDTEIDDWDPMFDESNDLELGEYAFTPTPSWGYVAPPSWGDGNVDLEINGDSSGYESPFVSTLAYPSEAFRPESMFFSSPDAELLEG